MPKATDVKKIVSRGFLVDFWSYYPSTRQIYVTNCVCVCVFTNQNKSVQILNKENECISISNSDESTSLPLAARNFFFSLSKMSKSEVEKWKM